ncbi:MAG: glycoside hydrolase family 3 C-terminal domain-containing protein [Actinomycetota bacterium]|nr:glycoside hydrolase family 3 C-terminal domain-containing protein [Actinomycetota bacterium]
MTDPFELARPLSGADWWNVPASGEVPAIKVTDGPSGARGERFAGGPPSVSFPCSAAIGASWDRELVGRVGAALAVETKAKGAQVLLGPTINLQRSPLGGRHFECLSEDPVLTAHLASAYVEGLQGAGVAACAKHLVANDTEADRFEISSEPDQRTLREVSLLPFEFALRRSGSWSTMAAYNRLYGTHCSENAELLTAILRDEWGWDGVVISDWFATRSVAPAALAGLDLEMPGPGMMWGTGLGQAVADGLVDPEVLVAKRERLALLGRRTGADVEPPRPDGPGGDPAVVALAREAGTAGLVLLRNEPDADGNPVLPLGSPATIAVVGPHGDREIFQGGGSAGVTPTDVTTIAGGLRERFDRVVVEPGCSSSRGRPALDGRHLRRADGTTGVDVEVIDGDGVVHERLRPRTFRVMFLDDPKAGAGIPGWSIRATTTFTPEATGVHRFKVRTADEATLFVAGQPVADDVELEAGVPVELRVEAHSPNPQARLMVEVRCAFPEPDDAFERAVRAAAEADVALVAIGLDDDWETEGRDRDHLGLPGRQVELVRAVAAVQPNTIVAVVAGSPVDLSWADEVPAVLWCWYPGQEGGRAIADVLSGDADPGGRLPCTMPARIEDTPAFFDAPPDPGVLRYHEGVFCGHRWYDARLIEPAFPFGHGLSYTTFELGAPTLSTERVDPGQSVTVTVPVRNTGHRGGSEVVQLYLGDDEATVRRAPRELRGFAKVHLASGQDTSVQLELGPRELAHWDARAGCWRAEAGRFTVWVGRSSRELGEPVSFELTGDWTAAPSDPYPASAATPAG